MLYFPLITFHVIVYRRGAHVRQIIIIKYYNDADIFIIYFSYCMLYVVHYNNTLRDGYYIVIINRMHLKYVHTTK